MRNEVRSDEVVSINDVQVIGKLTDVDDEVVSCHRVHTGRYGMLGTVVAGTSNVIASIVRTPFDAKYESGEKFVRASPASEPGLDLITQVQAAAAWVRRERIWCAGIRLSVLTQMLEQVRELSKGWEVNADVHCLLSILPDNRHPIMIEPVLRDGRRVSVLAEPLNICVDEVGNALDDQPFERVKQERFEKYASPIRRQWVDVDIDDFSCAEPIPDQSTEQFATTVADFLSTDGSLSFTFQSNLNEKPSLRLQGVRVLKVSKGEGDNHHLELIVDDTSEQANLLKFKNDESMIALNHRNQLCRIGRTMSRNEVAKLACLPHVIDSDWKEMCGGDDNAKRAHSLNVLKWWRQRRSSVAVPNAFKCLCDLLEEKDRAVFDMANERLANERRDRQTVDNNGTEKPGSDLNDVCQGILKSKSDIIIEAPGRTFVITDSDVVLSNGVDRDKILIKAAPYFTHPSASDGLPNLEGLSRAIGMVKSSFVIDTPEKVYVIKGVDVHPFGENKRVVLRAMEYGGEPIVTADRDGDITAIAESMNQMKDRIFCVGSGCAFGIDFVSAFPAAGTIVVNMMTKLKGFRHVSGEGNHRGG